MNRNAAIHSPCAMQEAKFPTYLPILMTDLQNECYDYPHFTDMETKALRSLVVHPKSQSQ